MAPLLRILDRNRIVAECPEASLPGTASGPKLRTWRTPWHYTTRYNFAKIHKTLRVTPAMEAGISNDVWSLDAVVGLMDRRTQVAA